MPSYKKKQEKDNYNKHETFSRVGEHIVFIETLMVVDMVLTDMMMITVVMLKWFLVKFVLRRPDRKTNISMWFLAVTTAQEVHLSLCPFVRPSVCPLPTLIS